MCIIDTRVLVLTGLRCGATAQFTRTGEKESILLYFLVTRKQNRGKRKGIYLAEVHVVRARQNKYNSPSPWSGWASLILSRPFLLASLFQFIKDSTGCRHRSWWIKMNRYDDIHLGRASLQYCTHVKDLTKLAISSHSIDFKSSKIYLRVWNNCIKIRDFKFVFCIATRTYMNFSCLHYHERVARSTGRTVLAQPDCFTCVSS